MELLSKKSLPLLIAVLLIAVLAIPALAAPSAQDVDETIVDIAAGDEQFSTLVSAIEAAGLVDTLASEGPFTVFAPTNAAFEALPEGTLDALLEDPEGALTDVLLYHALSGAMTAGEVAALDGQTIDSVGGSPLLVTVADDGSVMINEAIITVADIEASNGLVHVIDAVLVPGANGEEAMMVEEEAVAAEGEEAEAVAEEVEAEAVAEESDESVVESLSALFEQAAAALPTMAATEGEEAVAEGAEGEEAVAEAAESEEAVAEAAEGEEAVAEGEEAVAEAAPVLEFNIFSTALDVSGLGAAVLNADYPLTLFAPTDSAFEALPDGVLDELLASPTGKLRSILLYHMMAANAPAERIAQADGEEINTMAGKPIEVTVDGNEIVLNDSVDLISDLVVQPNIVIHAVDAVLMPLDDDDDDDETYYEHWYHHSHGHGYPHHKPHHVDDYSYGSKYHHQPMDYKHGYDKCYMY